MPRFAAAVIDLLLLTTLPFVIIQLAPYPWVIYPWVIGLPLWFLLYLSIEGFTGWTLGKLAVGLRVGLADGTEAGYGALLDRFVMKNLWLILSITAVATDMRNGKIVSQFSELAIVLGTLLVLSPVRQSLHDRATGTAVFKSVNVLPRALEGIQPFQFRYGALALVILVAVGLFGPDLTWISAFTESDSDRD